MRRVLLILEDYNELLFLETLLKKLSFDVESIRNEVSVGERLMAFAPDLVIATGEGHKINGARISKKVKRKGSTTKLLLLFPRNKIQSERALDAYVADAAVETPLNPRSVIASVCQLLNVNFEVVMQKFEKLAIAKEAAAATKADELQIIHAKTKKMPQSMAKGRFNPEDDKVRVKNYSEFLKNVPPSNLNGFAHNLVQEELAQIRKWEKEEGFTKLDEERKAFVTALFKK